MSLLIVLSPCSALYVVDLKKFRKIAAGDRLRGQYQGLSQDPNSLSNLDQVCVYCMYVCTNLLRPDSRLGPLLSWPNFCHCPIPVAVPVSPCLQMSWISMQDDCKWRVETMPSSYMPSDCPFLWYTPRQIHNAAEYLPLELSGPKHFAVYWLGYVEIRLVLSPEEK